MKEQLGKFAKSLRQGQTIYKVYALGESSYIQTEVVCSRPKKFGQSKFWGIDIKAIYENGEYGAVDTASLHDMNALIGCNGYNLHRVFFSKKKAEKYLAICTECDLGIKNDFYHDDYDFYHDDDCE